MPVVEFMLDAIARLRAEILIRSRHVESVGALILPKPAHSRWKILSTVLAVGLMGCSLMAQQVPLPSVNTKLH